MPSSLRPALSLEDLADSVDHRDGRSVAFFEDAQQHGAPAVVADDVLLHRPAVVHLHDVLEQHCLSVGVFDWNVVEVGDAHGHRIGAHRVLGVADLHETRGQSQRLSEPKHRLLQRRRAEARIVGVRQPRNRPPTIAKFQKSKSAPL